MLTARGAFGVLLAFEHINTALRHWCRIRSRYSLQVDPFVCQDTVCDLTIVPALTYARWQAQVTMADSADWSDLSRPLLTKIFELQHNALDNCAAACTCASWRCAVNRSHISFLHLHAERSFSYKHWSNFFLSKLSVGILRLTASIDFTCDMNDDNIWARTFMQQIASTCDHLDADEAFATDLHDLALQPAQLQKLTAWLPRQHHTESCCIFPDVRHLTQLTALHLHLKKKFSIFPVVGSETLSRIPESLKALVIQTQLREMGPSSIQALIQPCLAFIQTLRLEECSAAFVGGGITCLCNLTSFSTPSSSVWADINNLDKLTKLTCLDIARSTWRELCPRTGEPLPDLSGAFASFTGWPELKVLKIANCNLFCPSTQLNLPGVQEVHVNWVVPKLADIRLHLHLNQSAHAPLDPQCLLHPSCAICLVDLRLHLEYRVPGTGWAAILQQVLLICHSLQVLHLSSFGSGKVSLDDTVNIRLHEHCGEQLTQLHLVYVSCNILDLASSAFLTSVKLSCVKSTHGAAFQLSLPSSLRSLDYCGDLLFGSTCRQQLQHCSHLTYLAISPEKLYKLPECELPLLPSSLYHLQLRKPDYPIKDHEWVRGRSWDILNACTNLERLTLPGMFTLSGNMKETVAALRHLHVVDHYRPGL